MKFTVRYIAILGVIVFYFLELEQHQVLMMLSYSLLVLWADFRGFRLRRFDTSTAYAMLLSLTSISHVIALFGLSNNPWFLTNVYSAEMAGRAIFIFNVGSIVLMESMRTVIRTKIEKEENTLSSIIHTSSFVKLFIVSIVVFIVSSNFKVFLLSFGSFGSFIMMMVNGSVLLLSYIANATRKHVAIVLGYTLFLSLWALQFSYLRMEIVIPVVAYLGGDLLANRSVRRLHILSKALIVGSLVIFPPLFTFLGENRSKMYGAKKLDATLEMFENPDSEEGQTVMSRMSVIPQLSKIIMLTEKKGFYNGYTLSYLGYVFIPRFLWPEKPLIMQGQWFALEIGAAYKKKDGRANNSVNMTVPGEFYLNFGWPGVLMGCALFGCFIGWIWNQTSYTTIFGWVFRFYFIFLGLFSLGADLQIVPKLISYLILYKLLVFISDRVSAPSVNPSSVQANG
ncbi:MAG TPA: hypothetical protein VGK59_01775 [Ohtaekwangia sp.]